MRVLKIALFVLGTSGLWATAASAFEKPLSLSSVDNPSMLTLYQELSYQQELLRSLGKQFIGAPYVRKIKQYLARLIDAQPRRLNNYQASIQEEILNLQQAVMSASDIPRVIIDQLKLSIKRMIEALWQLQ